jgi:hypothetical protein
MIFFPNMTMKRYTYTTTDKGVYGETTMGYEYADEVLVDFQHEGNPEYIKAYGVERGNLYKVYIDKKVSINNSDVLVDPDDNQYQIIGEVQEYNHFHQYKRVHLVHSRGDKLCQLTSP